MTESGHQTGLEFPADAGCGFGREPFRFRHHLGAAGPFAMAALAELCDSVPRGWIAVHDGARPIVTPRGRLIAPGGPVSDVVLRLGEECRWLVVHHLEHISAYREPLDEVLEHCLALVDPTEGAILDRGATVFIGSPGAVVPVHLDRHHNFLLQIVGSKELIVGSFDDSDVQAREVERNFGRRSAGSHLVPERHVRFQLDPGDGVYIPANAFHWVEEAPGESVAFSCAFRTARSVRIEQALKFNANIGRLGLPRRPVTGSGRDALKALIVRVGRRLPSVARGRR
jgi:hypothetical protein